MASVGVHADPRRGSAASGRSMLGFYFSASLMSVLAVTRPCPSEHLLSKDWHVAVKGLGKRRRKPNSRDPRLPWRANGKVPRRPLRVFAGGTGRPDWVHENYAGVFVIADVVSFA
jgi:hypothetical protein